MLVRLARMAIAVLALVGAMISLYMVLFHLGYVGTLTCGLGGGCSTVQASRWAEIAGIPVAAVGLGGYLLILATSLCALSVERLQWLCAALLVALSSIALLFSAYLTALEAFVIHAWCQWCVISALLVVAIFGLSLVQLGPGRGER